MDFEPQFIAAIVIGIIGLIFAGILASRILKEDEGDEQVKFIGKAIQEGATAFLSREYRLLAIFVVIIFIILTLFVDYDILDKLESANNFPKTSISYLVGAIGSALAGFVGMAIATRANTRTAVKAKEGLNPALRVAFNSGSVMGISVVGIGLLSITILYLIFEDANILAGFGFGASSIALFARVGGGIFTKAADVGADLVGKIEAGIPEDDPRNPATIADNVGDNVGDVAGMGADLFESYVGAMIATLALASVATVISDNTTEISLKILPFVVATIGLGASIIGTFFVKTGENANMGKLLWSLRKGIFGAGAIVLVGTALYIFFNNLDFNLFWIILIGLVAGQTIGTASEVYTSYEFKFTKNLAFGIRYVKYCYTRHCRCGSHVFNKSTSRCLRCSISSCWNAFYIRNNTCHGCIRSGSR